MRSTRVVRTLALVAFLATAPAVADAYFFEYGPGVRPAGMGKTFVAVADDVNAVNWNPAGLATLGGFEFTAMYASLFMGLEARLYDGTTDRLGYGFVAGAYPVSPEIGTVGASWSQFGSHFFRENTFNLSYGRNLTYGSEKFQLGGNLKVLNWVQDANDYTEGIQRTAFTADAAFLYNMLDNLRIGAMLENWIPADGGYTTREEAPRNFHLGLAWKLDFQAGNDIIDDLLLAGEWINRSYDENKNTVAFGTEGWLFNRLLAFRAGVNSTEFTAGFSGNVAIEALNRTEFEIDYSFAWPFYIQKTYGTHRLALTIRQGGKPGAGNAGSWGKNKPSATAGKPDTLAALTALPAPAIVGASLVKPEKAVSTPPNAVSPASNASQPATETLEKALLKTQERIKNNELSPILFKKNQKEIEIEAYPTLDYIGEVFQQHPDSKIRIEVSPDGENPQLAHLRSEWIAAYLSKKFNIPSSYFIYNYPTSLSSNDPNSHTKSQIFYAIKSPEESSNVNKNDRKKSDEK